MRSLGLVSFITVSILSLQTSKAGVLEDFDNVIPYSYGATFDQSHTPEYIKEKFNSCAHQGQLSGVTYGNSIVNGYAQVVGAMVENRDSMAPYFKTPFVWLKNNPAKIPVLIKRNSQKLTPELVLFVNYLLSSYKTITDTPDWKTKFQKIRLLYSQFNNNWDNEAVDDWVQKNNFITTTGNGKRVIPDYVAWGLAKEWMGAHAFPSVFQSLEDNKAIVWNTNISFENYLASFWYRRWADGSMSAVYSTLKLLSAVMPRNFEAQTAHGFVDTIQSSLSRTGENWEIYPTPSTTVTFTLVADDGKTQLKAPWTEIVPTSAKVIDFMPLLDFQGYFMKNDSLKTSDKEGTMDSMNVVLAKSEGINTQNRSNVDTNNTQKSNIQSNNDSSNVKSDDTVKTESDYQKDSVSSQAPAVVEKPVVHTDSTLFSNPQIDKDIKSSRVPIQSRP